MDSEQNGPNAAILRGRLQRLAAETKAIAPEITLLFVTNLRDGPIRDLGPDGIDNAAQYYSQVQADGIIRSLQDLGLTVRSFFSEEEFFRAALSGEGEDQGRLTVVFTTAEGGTGSGRRALIPAFCSLMHLPFLNSGSHACSLACHKFHANAVLRQAGVRVPDTWMWTSDGWIGNRRPKTGTRVIIKPSYESMSIGVDEDSILRVSSSFDEVVASKRDLFRQDTIVQEFVTGEEVGVPLIRLDRTFSLPPIAFRRANGEPYADRARTFRAENIDRDTSITPFEASLSDLEVIRETTTAAFDALQLRGIGRIDIRMDADGRAWVFDTNIAPPPLAGTSFAASVGAMGFGLQDMLAIWLGACLLHYGFLSGI
jgi:D-alanine-D-alanine ligase